jgi:hypothetical protein
MKSPKLVTGFIATSEKLIAGVKNGHTGYTPSKYFLKENIIDAERFPRAESGNKSMIVLEEVSPAKKENGKGLANVDNAENIKKMINEHNQKLMLRMRSGSRGKKAGKEPESAGVRSRAPSIKGLPTYDKVVEKISTGIPGIPRAPAKKEENKEENKNRESIWSKAGKFVKTKLSIGSKDPTDPNSNAGTPKALYICSCNLAPEFARIKTDSMICCARTFSWLNRRYSPYNLESTLTKYFDDANFSLLPKDTRNAVQKDVVRTFSSNTSYNNPEAKRELQSLLMVFISQYPEVGYVQGMNYIAAAVYYHCSMTISLGVLTIIFECLELRDIF